MSSGMEHGLMSQIQALVNPVPNFSMEFACPRSERQHSKKNRTHNRDSCDACGDNGDLLNCDTCPASFHHLCADPPLEEEVVSGSWICKMCAYAKENGTTTFQRHRRNEAMPLQEGRVSAVSAFFTQACQNAANINPLEFKLSAEFGNIEPAFPGTSRHVYKRSCPLRSKQIIVEMENFMVPKPTSICHICRRSCRIGALIKCDLCPKFYHLDCLTPPLTVPPSTIFACPMHPEPFLESKLLMSTLMSERIRLWDHTNEAIDGNKIKRDFIRKVRRRQNICFRKIKKTPMSAFKVPSTILNCYKYKTATEQSAHSDLLWDFEIGSKANDNDPELEPPKQKGNVLEGNLSRPNPVFKPLHLLAGVATSLEQSNLECESSQMELLQNLDLNTIKSLAAQKLNELLNGTTSVTAVRTEVEQEQQTVKPSCVLTTNKKETKLVLYCSTTAKVYVITKMYFDVGIGSQVDLNLVGSGCKNISKKHASIYYDQISMKWELLNYSMYGTMVNNCLYLLNGLPRNKIGTNDKTSGFKNIIQKRKKSLLGQNNASCKEKIEENCRCVASGMWNGDTWEGAATLELGDEIQIGCMKFVVKQQFGDVVEYVA